MKQLEDEIKALKPEFEAYISDKSLPLTERWHTWIDAPDSLKRTSGWISDGRLEAFKLIGYGDRHNDAIQYEGGLIWAERYQTINMVYIIDSLIESLLDRYEIEPPEDHDWNDMDAYETLCPELHEFFIAYREEPLEKNLLSFKFDR